MKTRFLKAFAAVVMLFSFCGFVRAEGELAITASIENAGENVTLSAITDNACSATDVVLADNTTLTLTCDGAEIYYTTNGATPAKPVAKEGESTLYSAPIVLAGTMVADGKIIVKAIAYKQASTPDAGAKASAEESDVLTITLTLKAADPVEPETVAAPTFNPADGAEVEAGTTVTLTAEDASIFYVFAADKAVDGYVAYSEDSKPAIDADKLTLWAYARTGSSEADYKYSDTVKAVYTLKTTNPEDPETVAVPTFVKKEGADADTIIVLKGEADSLFVAAGHDSISAVAAGFAKFIANDTIAVNEDTVIVAYTKKGELVSDTVKYTYTKTTEPVDPTRPAAPVFTPDQGAVAANTPVVIAKGEADSIFVATGKSAAEAIVFTKYTADVTVNITNDTVIRAYAVKADAYSDTVTKTYTIKGEEPVGVEVDDLAGLVALYNDFDKDQVYTVKGEVTIAGIIVSGNRTNALVQDKNCEETKGHSMLLYGVTLPENAKVGDVLKDLSGKLTTYSGLLEMTGVTVAAAGTTADITIDTVTIAELKADETMAYQNALVCVEEVVFDCDTTFASGKNYNLIQGTDTLAFRANGGADYIGMDIPAEKITLIGYMGYFNAYQISPRSKADIIDGSVVAEVAAPTFDPEAGAVEKDTKVTVSSTTEGAEIWIAVGEGEFEKKNEVTISEAVTLRAVAKKDGVCSDTVEAAYTIKNVANKDFQTADVKVYPNPNNGMFFVELSEASLVEVFSANGMLCLRQQLPAGTSTLNVANSGFYFVRINNNIVKRIVVR